MGQQVWPPYEDFRDKTERWQQFEKQLRWQVRLKWLLAPSILLFFVALGLWVALAVGGS